MESWRIEKARKQNWFPLMAENFRGMIGIDFEEWIENAEEMSMRDAVNNSCYWSESPQGHGFWRKIYESLDY